MDVLRSVSSPLQAITTIHQDKDGTINHDVLHPLLISSALRGELRMENDIYYIINKWVGSLCLSLWNFQNTLLSSPKDMVETDYGIINII